MSFNLSVCHKCPERKAKMRHDNIHFPDRLCRPNFSGDWERGVVKCPHMPFSRHTAYWKVEDGPHKWCPYYAEHVVAGEDDGYITL